MVEGYLSLCRRQGRLTETAETLDRYNVAGGDVHVADSVEESDTCTEERCGRDWVNVAGNAHGCLGAECAVFGI